MGEDRPSVAVLREHGPLTLREITRLSADKTGVTQWYQDIAAILESEARRGIVVRDPQPGTDWRDQVWRINA